MKALFCAAALALAPPGTATACEYLTPHFELCSEGTPWAEGRWENGGDSATLYVDDIGYEGFEGYSYYDPTTSIDAEMEKRNLSMAEDMAPVPLLADRLASPEMTMLRVIETVTNEYIGTEVWATLIAEDTRDPETAGPRILLQVRAPAGTPLDQMDRLSREYAALVRPRQIVEGE